MINDIMGIHYIHKKLNTHMYRIWNISTINMVSVEWFIVPKNDLGYVPNIPGAIH